MNFTRASAPQAKLDLELWPTIDLTSFSDMDHEKLNVWMDIVKSYVSGENVNKKLRVEKVTYKQLLRRFNNCITIAPDGRLYGWRGLVPGLIRKKYERKATVATTRGSAGALHQLFKKIDGLEGRMTQLVLKRKRGREDIPEPRIRNLDVHKAFIEECRQAGIGPTEWPFNARWLGRRAIDKFISDVIQTNPERAARVRYGEVAGSKMLTGTGHERILLADAPLDVAEMDSHTQDLIGVVGIPTPDGEIWVPIERVQILLVADAKGAILGYYVVIRRICSGEDMLAAAVPMVKPWAPRKLCVSGMSYMPGSGLPLGTIEGMVPYGICALMLDNALCNLSWAVVDRLIGRLGCCANWGPVRKWMRRPVVERIFLSLEQMGFQRVVSTMGSGPKDPKRDHPVQAATKYRVHLDLILDLIDIEIARYNATPSEGRFGLTPLEVIRQAMPGGGRDTLFPMLPPVSGLAAELDTIVFKGRIRGNLKTGHRPSVKYQRARYTNATISSMPQLIGEKVLVHVKPNDIRTVEVYLERDGASLGLASVQGNWRVKPHSLELRKQINRAIDERRLELGPGEDPVTAMHRALGSAAAANHKPKKPKVSHDATVLARESNATGVPINQLVAPLVEPVQPPITHSARAPKFQHKM